MEIGGWGGRGLGCEEVGGGCGEIGVGDEREGERVEEDRQTDRQRKKKVP